MTITERYRKVFELESRVSYPTVSQFEETCGYALDETRLLPAARVLACPLKQNPPNWQHGRVIYAAARRLLTGDAVPGMFLDIGSAKGFSATVMTWAIADSGMDLPVWSVDIVDPYTRVSRNSVLEVNGDHQLPTVPEFVEPFVDPKVPLRFFGHGSEWLLKHLMRMDQRIRFAFVDGKHNFESVSMEMEYLSRLQGSGDVVVIDDLQIPGVLTAVNKIRDYELTRLNVLALRAYAIGVRK